MKRWMLSILSGLLLSMTFVAAQENSNGMIHAFKSGSAGELSDYLGKKVELVIFDNTKEYDKQGAQRTMTDFFSANKVAEFVVNHRGQRDGSGFIVGMLSTQTGVYRINCFFKKTGNQYLIYQIRIDKTNE